MNLAYVAGFFDGEGCINFGRCRATIFPRILVVNTDRSILEMLQRKFGGDIKPLSLRKPGWKQGWLWRLSWSRAVDFLSAIEPYVRVKDRQIHTVFAWDAIRPRVGKLTAAKAAEYRDCLELLVKRMHWLNQKGENLEPDPIIAEARKR